jgi:enolase
MKEGADVISKIRARQILDSRGRPTVEVDVITRDGSLGRAAVPSGASKGSHEALELRDGDPKKFMGYGVLKAVANVNDLIRPKVTGVEATHQSEIDSILIELDGTPERKRLGANAILGVSLAATRAAARALRIPLYRHFNRLFGKGKGNLIPIPLINVISGGLHAKGIDVQDLQVIPLRAPNFTEALSMVGDTLHKTKEILKKNGNPSLGLADEGGFGPVGISNAEALDILVEAIEEGGFSPGKDMSIAVDFASSAFYSRKRYLLTSEKKTLSGSEMIDYVAKLCSEYPILSIEDPLSEDDWEGWKELTRKLGKRIQIIGDDLFVTNSQRLMKGIRMEAGNAILIKMNQVGTITETLETLKTAKENLYSTIVSARSGETEDSSIADLAVGTCAGQIKVGSLQRSSRLVKWNQLLRIEEELGNDRAWNNSWSSVRQISTSC